MKYKALICDVDGTLVPNKKGSTVSSKVKEAIAKANTRIHIGLATTRPIFLLSDIVKDLALSGPSVISGGAEIVDLSHNKVLRRHLILEDDLKFLIQTLTEKNLPLKLDNGQKQEIYDKNKSYEVTIKAFTLALDEEVADKLLQALADRSNLAKFKIPSWTQGKYDVFITHSSATKQHGILEVAELLGISTHEIIGVGDGHNDFPLLMACGFKVAMGNAVEDLKAIADYIAPSVENDGVADVIEKYILNQI